MAKKVHVAQRNIISKRTSIGNGNIKTSTMNKDKKRSFKKYRGQGK